MIWHEVSQNVLLHFSRAHFVRRDLSVYVVKLVFGVVDFDFAISWWGPTSGIRYCSQRLEYLYGPWPMGKLAVNLEVLNYKLLI